MKVVKRAGKLLKVKPPLSYFKNKESGFCKNAPLQKRAVKRYFT